jgi:hypothetical protein
LGLLCTLLTSQVKVSLPAQVRAPHFSCIDLYQLLRLISALSITFFILLLWMSWFLFFWDSRIILSYNLLLVETSNSWSQGCDGSLWNSGHMDLTCAIPRWPSLRKLEGCLLFLLYPSSVLSPSEWQCTRTSEPIVSPCTRVCEYGRVLHILKILSC